MPKPVSEWTENDVLSLSQDENSTFERKGSQLLDITLKHVREGDVRDELAKQLSAFANMGGGQIIYGVSDAGTVDNGGVARSVKGKQSTKEWLENVIPTLTEFEILGFNVYEIPPKATDSSIDPNKSIYVVDVPESERAPHQSKRDLKYYVRLGGKSQPAPHRLIEDIRNRFRHPELEVHDLTIARAMPGAQGYSMETSQFPLNITLRFGIRNRGKVRATSACLLLAATVPITANATGAESVFRNAVPGTVLLEFSNPFYPDMGIMTNCSIQIPATVSISPPKDSLSLGGYPPEEVLLKITTYADSAPPHKREFSLNSLLGEQAIQRVIVEESTRVRIQMRRPR